ncbi:hypothetical protein [Variovorax sp. V15]|uniref:hypothetical protein n=1 Tax=Variovorax sp. V15 TaxID=3065952 RepID=UPI0034E87CCA
MTMSTFLLLGACTLLLAINVYMARRIRAIEDIPLRKNMLLVAVWILPFVGAFFAWTHLPRQLRPSRAKTRPEGFTTTPAPERIALDDGPAFSLPEHMTLCNGLPLLDWKAVDAWTGAIDDPGLRYKGKLLAQRAWLLHLRDALGPHFHLHESDKAFVLSSLEDVVAVATSAYVATTRTRIQRLLADIAHFEEHGKSILVVMDDDDAYYDYVSGYYPDSGEFAFSGGMFIDAGCPHFLVKRADLAAIEPVIAHEMTHSALSHLKLPRWLDEGLAVNTERKLAGAGVLPLGEREQLRRSHLKFWDEARIQEFWSGASFFRTDEGNQLSYELARILVEQMGQNWELFTRFASSAKREDGGAEAAREVYDMDLGAYACILMEREPDAQWTPDPQSWRDEERAEEESPA